MSEEKGTAASPEVEETKDEEQKDKTEEKTEEEQERIANRPLHHVLVRHMGRSPRTRTQRAARAGHRRQGVLLDDGTRVRKKGRRRYTEVDLRTFAHNHAKLLEYVRVGQVEVCDPRTEQRIPYEVLLKILHDVGHYITEQDNKRVLEAYELKLEEWKELCKELKKLKKDAPPKPEKPEMAEFKVIEAGVQQDPVVGSTPLNTAPDVDPPTTGTSSDEGEDEGDAEGDAEGGEDDGDGEVLDEGSEITEEQLLKMSRGPLNDFAKQYVDEPEKMKNKQEVVDAIFAAIQAQEGEE